MASEGKTDHSTTLEVALAFGELGYKIVPIPRGEKFPRGLPRWQEQATNSAAQLTAWWGSGDYGIGWAMGLQPNGKTLATIDIDIADGKRGKRSLADLIAELDLAEIVKSTVVSQTGSGGRHLIFDVAGAPVRNGVLAPGLDIRGEGGFIVVPPSVHPNGQAYAWVTGKSPFQIAPAVAPERLIARLTGSQAERIPAQPPVRPAAGGSDDSPGDWARRNLQIGVMLTEAGWVEMAPRGDDRYWCRPGKDPRDGHSAILHGEAPLVVWSTSVADGFRRAGLDNRDGSVTLSPLEVYAAIHHHGDVVGASRALRREQMPRIPRPTPTAPTAGVAEAVGIGEGSTGSVEDTVAQLNLVDEFWEARPWLAHIRQAAHHRLVSPDAVLLAVLARYAALIPPTLRLPAVIGSEATFDFIGCAVANSSGGKTAANSVAADLLPIARKDLLIDLPVGSGEGLIQSFLVPEVGDDGKPTGKQVVGMTGAHFCVDEGTALMEQQRRQGTTIVQTLCSAWSGTTLGQANASAETRRIIEARRVRVSCVIAIQTANGHLMLDERLIAIGLPQRVCFAYAHAPLPEAEPDWPGVLALPVPPTISGAPVPLTVAPEIVQELRTARRAVATGQVVLPPLDGHLGLLRLKLAGLLAIADGSPTIDSDVWALSGQIVVASTAVRDRLVGIESAARQRRELASAVARIERDAAAHDAAEARAIDALVQRIVAKLEVEPLTFNKLRKAVTSSTTKERFDPALELAVRRGLVRVVEIGGQGQRGSRVEIAR